MMGNISLNVYNNLIMDINIGDINVAPKKYEELPYKLAFLHNYLT
jgi:hypothetical protein